jgi:anamorsin
MLSKQLKDDLLFAGFLDAAASTAGVFAVRATKPNFQVGTAFSLQTKQQTSISSQNNHGSAVKVSLDEDGDDAMVDDSDLLEEDDLRAPSQQFDCGPGDGPARKACKNCSCGLSKKQQADAAKNAVAAARSAAAADGTAVKLDLDAIEVPTSSCGNCYLGDAFRCATCPFLGKPAFKKGEEKKVLLDLNDDA